MGELVPENRGQVPVRRDNTTLRGTELSDPFWAFHREVSHEVRLFEGSLSAFDRSRDWPTVGVSDRGGEVQVRVELPGFDETEIKVELADGALIIEGESRSEHEDRNEPFSQRGYRKFERRIPLDWDIEEDKVAASFRNGLLSVTLPKPAPVQEPTKRIPINIR